MRLLIALLIAAAAASPATAAPALIGTDGHGPVTLLDADLQPVPGSPKLATATDGIVASPNGKRWATWSFEPGTITIRDTATGAAQARLKSEPGEDVYWPTRHHVVTANSTEHARRPIVVRSFDLKKGTSKVTRLPGDLVDQALVGNEVRLLVAGAGGFTVYDIGAAGALLTQTRLTLPDGMDTHAATSLSGGVVLVSELYKHAVVRLDGTITPVALPKGYWNLVGDRFVTDGHRVATLNLGTGAVGTVVDTGDQSLTPYEDGLIAGLGRTRYDADLNQVADNPDASTLGHFSVLVANDRLYAYTFDCDSVEGMTIVDRLREP